MRQHDSSSINPVLCLVHSDGKDRSGKQCIERPVLLPEACTGAGFQNRPYESGNSGEKKKAVHDSVLSGNVGCPGTDYWPMERDKDLPVCVFTGTVVPGGHELV